MMTEDKNVDFTSEIVRYIKDKYDINPKKPWAKYPEYMTFSEKIKNKWFAVILQVSYEKLHISKEGKTFILNIKLDDIMISLLKQETGFLPCYHMNKDHWITILLDKSVDLERIFTLIDDSYIIVSDSPTKRIYEAVKKIPKGKVATYAQVAFLAGDKNMARAVGNALHKNPDPSKIPCHRVVNAKGMLAQNFAFDGISEQAKRLEKEGIKVLGNKVDLSIYGINLDEDENDIIRS